MRTFLFGLIAIGLAFASQQRLAAGAGDALPWNAVALYLEALLLFVVALQWGGPWLHTGRLAVGVALFDLRDKRSWLSLLPALMGVSLAWMAFDGVDLLLPPLQMWRLHFISVLFFLITAYLLDVEWVIPHPNPPQGGEGTAILSSRDLGSSSDLGEVRQGLKSPVSSLQSLVSNLGEVSQGAESPVSSLQSLISSTWGQRLAFAGIIGVALFMRLWRFENLPFGVWFDEAQVGLQAQRILADLTYRPIFVAAIPGPIHYPYLIALSFQLFGVNILAIRAVSVAAGVVGVVGAYLAGREFFGQGDDGAASRWWGLALACLLAVSRWHVNFSRIGMYNIFTPLFELWTIGLLLRALRRGRLLEFGLAGLCLGLGLCFYAAFQLFVGVLLVYLLALAILQRDFLRRSWPGLLILLCTALLTAAPVLLFARQNPTIYFARTKETSLFTEKKPGERLPALMENARKHLLMFNYRGDPNGRHNLPYRPMLDPWTGALLVLGVGWSLWRCWQPRSLLLLGWLAGTLLGGILSLDFEAPQSLRSIGSLPVVYLLALMPLYLLWQVWREAGKTYSSHWFATPVSLLLATIGYTNFHTYFYQQATDFAVWNAFSTPETIAAQLLNQQDAQTDTYITSYFYGHPTLRFVAQITPPYQAIKTTDHLPLPWKGDKKIALILSGDSRALFNEAKRYYPHALFREFTSPTGGPAVVYYALLSAADIQQVQGVTARYYANPTWAGEPQLERNERKLQLHWPDDAPLAAPFSAEWRGVLHIADDGDYQFALAAPDHAQFWIDEQAVLSGTGVLTGTVSLAEGNHALRLRAVSGQGAFALTWRPPNANPEPLPASALYVAPVASNGLLGRYFPNGDWQTPPALARIDPELHLYFHAPVLPRPYTVEWTGKIAIPQSGRYRFGLESIDESWLWIDEEAVTAGLRPNEYTEGSLELTQGLHDIRVRFADRTDHTHINLYWIPPFGQHEIIPASVLIPPQGNYAQIALPDLKTLAAGRAPPPLDAKGPTPDASLLQGQVRWIFGDLLQPKSIVIDAENDMYIADTGNRRVVKIAPNGALLHELALPTGVNPWQEPFDLALDGQGRLYVLDAGGSRIVRFAADDAYLETLPIDPIWVDRARGIDVDAQGRIWIANTPGGRIVALDEQGALLQDLPVWPGENSQPVDVLATPAGDLFVTDAGLHKLIHFDAAGNRLGDWSIPPATTLDGSHLTQDANGLLYMSKPEIGVVTQLNVTGAVLAEWSVAWLTGNGLKPVGLAVDRAGAIWFTEVAGSAVYVLTRR